MSTTTYAFYHFFWSNMQKRGFLFLRINISGINSVLYGRKFLQRIKPMPFYFTVLSSVAVSIDALVAGAAIGARCDRKNLQRTLFTVVAAVTALCAAAYLFARSVNRSFPPFSENLGGPILMAIAFFEAVKKDKPSLPLRKRRVITFYEAFVTGVGIGVDGAFACVSAVLTGGGAEMMNFISLFKRRKNSRIFII